jgi:hypothetical protein
LRHVRGRQRDVRVRGQPAVAPNIVTIPLAPLRGTARLRSAGQPVERVIGVVLREV